MTESKHTPGPWTYSRDGDDDLSIMGANDRAVVAGCGCCGSPFGGNLQYDAPLMTASPDMLEALKQTVAELHSIHAQFGDADNARQHSAGIRLGEAAIARAEGRSEGEKE